MSKPAPRALAALEIAAIGALGALQTLAFVRTAWWPLPMVAVAVLAWRLSRAAPKYAFLLGWSFGIGWLVAGVWWLFISMHRYGGLAAPLAALAVLALAAALSLYLAFAMWAFARWRPGSPGRDALAFAALWLLAELARGVLFTGFPWVASGYSQIDGPLAVLAPWVGVYGMGAVLAWLSAAFALGLSARRPVWAGAAALVLAATAVMPVVSFTRPAGELSVALVQTNVPQDEKFSAVRLPQTLAAVHTALLEATADLVVVPETAVPLLPDQLNDFVPGYWQALVDHFKAPHTAPHNAQHGDRPRAALIGVPLGDFERGYTNSVMGLTAAPAFRYDKAHLVPFGEFIPTGFRWFTEMMNIPLGDFARGRLDPPPFVAAGQRIAPNICYEDLFGEELARRFVDVANAPTLLANLSNIGWFGRTIAVDQHLHISRARTLEFQVPMVRATNTGTTAAITHEGHVAALVLPHTRGTLVAQVQGREGATPYAAWAGRFGLWPLAACAVVVGALGLGRRKRAM